jgi:phage/plasmid-associated DNA primase
MADAPEAVRADLAESAGEADGVAQWLAECAEPGGPTQATGPFEDYQAWCKRLDERPVSQTAFGRRLTKEGYPADFGGANKNIKVRGL